MDTILAENMKRLREKYNLTQEIVAVSLGVPDLVVYRWEAGREYPDKRMIKKIAEFYEISVNELLENKVEVAPERPTADHLPENCKMCGGELTLNHLAGTCKCANCGKTKAIADLYPGYVKYAPITKALNKANSILNNRTTLASADEAKLLFKQAIDATNFLLFAKLCEVETTTTNSHIGMLTRNTGLLCHDFLRFWSKCITFTARLFSNW